MNQARNTILLWPNTSQLSSKNTFNPRTFQLRRTNNTTRLNFTSQPVPAPILSNANTDARLLLHSQFVSNSQFVLLSSQFVSTEHGGWSRVDKLLIFVCTRVATRFFWFDYYRFQPPISPWRYILLEGGFEGAKALRRSRSKVDQ